MIVVMRAGAPEPQLEAVLSRIAQDGQPVHVFRGEERVVVAVLGESLSARLFEALEVLAGVEAVNWSTRPYRLASREAHPASTVVPLGRAAIGGPNFVVGIGAARLADREVLVELTERGAQAGAGLFWLTRPPGSDLAQTLPLVAELRRSTHLPLLVEIWGPDELDPLATYVDGLLVGPQHLNSYPLLRALARSDRPVMLTRGPATSVEEWLLVADQILQGGNSRVMLCEQGIRTYETAVRSTLDFSSVAIIKRVSHLPVLGSPSLACGRREMVGALAQGVAAVGADGVLIDVHLDQRDEAAAGQQSISSADFAALAQRLAALAVAVRAARV